MTTVTVKLSKPIEHNGITHTEAVFAREASVGDLIVADTMKGDFAKMVAVFAAISGIPLPAFKQITATDMQKIMLDAGHLVGNASAPQTDGEE